MSNPVLTAVISRQISRGEPVIVEQPTEACKTTRLQASYIHPIWAVWYGASVNLFHTRHHADQFARALRLNGTEFRLFDGKGCAL